MQAVDGILAEEYRVQSTSQLNAARKHKEPRRWGTPPLSYHGYREKKGGPNSKGGCYVYYRQNRDHHHDHTCCDVNTREKAKNSSATLTRSRSVTGEVAVIAANIVRSTLTGSATLN